MADKVAILQCLAMLTDTWPKEPFTERRQQIYEMALADIDSGLLKAAIMSCVATCTFFPQIAEIRKVAADLVQRASGQLSAYEAWGDLVQALGRGYSMHRKPPMDDLTRRALDGIGGWLWFCNSTNVAADRARFIQAYEQLLNRQVNDIMQLPGVVEYVQQLAQPNDQQVEIRQLAEKLGMGKSLARR